MSLQLMNDNFVCNMSNTLCKNLIGKIWLRHKNNYLETDKR